MGGEYMRFSELSEALEYTRGRVPSFGKGNVYDDVLVTESTKKENIV